MVLGLGIDLVSTIKTAKPGIRSLRCIYNIIQGRKAGFYAVFPQLLIWGHGDYQVLALIIIHKSRDVQKPKVRIYLLVSRITPVSSVGDCSNIHFPLGNICALVWRRGGESIIKAIMIVLQSCHEVQYGHIWLENFK